MNNDNLWLALFLLAASNPDFFKNVEAEREREKQEKEIQDNCPFIEWEHDMGATIPFCGRDGGNEFCNMQCMGR